MKKLFVLFFVVISFSLFSCEKVIEVDLEEADPALVIEALLNQNEGRITVEITKSGPYFSAGDLQRLNDAEVALSNADGLITTLDLTGDGFYEASVVVEAEQEYYLEVIVEGQRYFASSYLPSPISLTGLSTDFVPATGLFEEGFFVYARYQDPGQEQNYYRLKYELNGEPQNGPDDLNVFDDQLNNGSLARVPVVRETFEAGTVIRAELIHFDKASFEYFNSLSDIISQDQGPAGGSAAPGNPLSNWDKDVLGYFSAFNSDTLTIVVE